MKQYLNLLQDILESGKERNDRTGIGTISVFGRQIRFDLSKGFPAVTTKSLAWRAIVAELLWFLEGSTSEHRLAEIKNDGKPYSELSEKERKTIWTLNAENQGKDLGYENGELGRIYGAQWRKWLTPFLARTEKLYANGESYPEVYYDVRYIDQISKAIEQIKNNPTSRRIIVNAWNVGEIDKMALPPCHYGFQFYVDGDNLSLMWNQRSVDCFLGLPFNIASYALLLHIIAYMTGKVPHELIGNLGDCHIYKNHLEQVKEQVSRTPHKLPTLKMPEVYWAELDDYLLKVKTSDFVLENYEHDDTIKAPMAV